jgi:hypothetical protein
LFFLIFNIYIKLKSKFMARPFAYNPSGATISGCIQVGDIAIGVASQDYFPRPGGVLWWNGPDENPGYIIAKAITNGSQPNSINRITGNGQTASIGFNRSETKTDESFLDLVKIAYGQVFGSASEAKTWLNNNGYWTSWEDTWKYNSSVNLSWPSDTTGYTLYTGSVTSIDDGYASTPITLTTDFYTNGQSSNQLYVSTNGYFTIGNGSGSIISTPQTLSNPAAMAANPSDNWLQLGLTNTDGDVQNIYYQTGNNGNKHFVKLIVYAGTYGNPTSPTSYVINFYRDSVYQWLETRVKSNVRGNAGPYNDVDVSQQSSTTSRVWRGDLNGQNWEYLGFGSIES